MTRTKRGLKNKDNKSDNETVVAKESDHQIKPNLKPKRGRGRPPMKRRPIADTTDETDDVPSPAPKTPSVESVVKRKRVAKVNTESKIFSQKEKKAFYECLKENGISCLNDEPLLEQLFPNRSMTEIRAMIDGFSRKAQDLNRKTEESVAGLESDPNASKQPIEKWFDLIHQMIPNPSKKDDISAVLIDLFGECRDQWPSDQINSEEEVLRPNYRAVYDCIEAALNGKYAKQMQPINAFIVVKLIEELKQLIKNDLNKKEMDFLRSGFWWQIPNQTNAQKSNEDILKSIHSQRQQQNGSAEDSQSNDQMDDNRGEEQNRELVEEEDIDYETLKSYPKLRKIIECLNPLRVPIDLTAEEYNNL